MPSILEVSATACLFLFSVQTIESQQPHENDGTRYFIERIDVEGYRRIQSATMRDHMLSRPGDPYNADAVQRDAQTLRDTGYFDDVRLRVEDSPDRPNGKILVFLVIERPIIRRIEYTGIKSITEADILKGIKDNEITLSTGSQFDKTMLTRAATVIEGLLSAHGRRSATVKPTYKRDVSSNAVSIVFNVDEGSKAQSSKNLP
jgi:outer membrane protein insertion porin family